MFSRKTKIVCSMGPTTETVAIVESLLHAGMNVARFNFSHSTHDYHKVAMERVRQASANTGIPVALLLDTKGPEIRTGVTENNTNVAITKGDIVHVSADGVCTTAASNGKPAQLSVSWKELPKKAYPGVRILIADGLIELDVLETNGTTITCKAANSGAIGSKKNVNLIGLHAGLPIMADQDKKDIAFGVKMEVDFIAASFVSFEQDVVIIRKYLDSLHSSARIIAKIENEEGLNNIKEIIAASDGIMVARGDLGVQLATERIPLAQKHIISECHKAGKPVITATQMLESMIVNPRPTRAELTDVANAILDGTDAVMLSGETANGAYPFEAVETMARIAHTVEDSDDYRNQMRTIQNKTPADYSTSGQGSIAYTMAQMAYLAASDIGASAIVAPTLVGNTARLLSSFRPEQPIIAVTPNEQVKRQLLLNWGVVPFCTKIAEDSEEMVQNAIKIALDSKVLKQFDRIVMVAGIPIFSPVMSNTVRVLVVGTILARGALGCPTPGKTTGRIVRSVNLEEAFLSLKKKGGEILVCPSIDMSYVPILRVLQGLIIENISEIPEETFALINPNLKWIAQVPNAMKIFESGQTVTIDTAERIVYEGTV